MPHLKCVPCRTRRYSAASAADEVADLCPDCGTRLEPVDDLTQIVGFQSVKAGEGPQGEGVTSQTPANGVGDLIARRDEILARSWLDTGPWIDEHGSLRAEAVALPPPGTKP